MSEPTDDDDRTILTDEALDAWPAAQPPAGFADRVLAARSAPAQRPRRRRLWIAVGGATLLAVTVAALALRPGGTTERGTLAADRRTETRLGTRAAIVAEAGTTMRWTVAPQGDARVEQDAGDVFYRVEHGGPFVVATPAGEVEVLGTCFRVEVTDMKIGKQGFAGAAIGTAATAVVMVTVYEGRVLFANEKGKTELQAGERATAPTGGAPGPAVSAKPRPRIVVAETAPPAGDASKEQLLVRDAAQRKEIAGLKARLAELEAGGESGGGILPVGEKLKWSLRPSHDELVEMAKQCAIQFDTPPADGEHAQLPPRLADSVGLTPDEKAQIEKAMDALNAQVLGQVRALYLEVTGNASAAEDLSLEAMINEVREKGGRKETMAAAQQLSAERAGLVPVPADVAVRPPGERLLRLLAGEGTELEQRVAQIIGPDRAQALRGGNGWGATARMAGCANESAEETK